MYNRFSNDLYYLHSVKNGIDVDFYLPTEHAAIQVSWMVDEFSSERELGNLAKLAEKDDVEIKLVPLYKLLLKMSQ